MIYWGEKTVIILLTLMPEYKQSQVTWHSCLFVFFISVSFSSCFGIPFKFQRQNRVVCFLSKSSQHSFYSYWRPFTSWNVNWSYSTCTWIFDTKVFCFMMCRLSAVMSFITCPCRFCTAVRWRHLHYTKTVWSCANFSVIL